ncbi:unnamed protein product [Porites lobata]|uniref:Uncharacterized protein n=1 Tax=Porites lobata TaxID=104759 RepID=A0ABN8NQL1_9CNID|nr:unnamed protein product [Porites lobata]
MSITEGKSKTQPFMLQGHWREYLKPHSRDLSENHPSQEPMGPCSSERVSWLKIKRLKKKILGSLSGNRGRPAAPEVSLRVANKSVRETNRRGKQREKK